MRLGALLEIGEHHGQRVRRQRPVAQRLQHRSAGERRLHLHQPGDLIVEVVVESIDVFLRRDTDQEALAHAIEDTDQRFPNHSSVCHPVQHHIKPDRVALR